MPEELAAEGRGKQNCNQPLPPPYSHLEKGFPYKPLPKSLNHRKMSLIYMKMNLTAEHIFIWMTSHQDSIWQRQMATRNWRLAVAWSKFDCSHILLLQRWNNELWSGIDKQALPLTPFIFDYPWTKFLGTAVHTVLLKARSLWNHGMNKNKRI